MADSICDPTICARKLIACLFVSLIGAIPTSVNADAKCEKCNQMPRSGITREVCKAATKFNVNMSSVYFATSETSTCMCECGGDGFDAGSGALEVPSPVRSMAARTDTICYARPSDEVLDKAMQPFIGMVMSFDKLTLNQNQANRCGVGCFSPTYENGKVTIRLRPCEGEPLPPAAVSFLLAHEVGHAVGGCGYTENGVEAYTDNWGATIGFRLANPGANGPLLLLKAREPLRIYFDPTDEEQFVIGALPDLILGTYFVLRRETQPLADLLRIVVFGHGSIPKRIARVTAGAYGDTEPWLKCGETVRRDLDWRSAQ